MFVLKTSGKLLGLWFLVLGIWGPSLAAADDCLGNVEKHCDSWGECCGENICFSVAPGIQTCRNSFFDICYFKNRTCKAHSDCCSNRCEEFEDGSKRCFDSYEPSKLSCKGTTKACKYDFECCSKYCSGNVCLGQEYKVCVSEGSCLSDFDCCSRNCDHQQCEGKDLEEALQCVAEGEACEESSQCCNGLCDFDKNEQKTCITYHPEECVDNGLYQCSPSDCCSGLCSAVSTEISVCRSYDFWECLPGDEPCENHADCCSRRCDMHRGGVKLCYGPYEPSSLWCKKDGASCVKSIDCCSKLCERDGFRGLFCKGSDYKPCAFYGLCVRDEDCCTGECEYNSKIGDSFCVGQIKVQAITCIARYEPCLSSNQCCDGVCDEVDKNYACIPYLSPKCLENVVHYCESSADCCSTNVCVDVSKSVSVCRNSAMAGCKTHGERCSMDRDCCSRRCEGSHNQGSWCIGNYEKSYLTCKKFGEDCFRPNECCSKRCGSFIDAGEEFIICLGSNDYKPCVESGKCSSNSDCCSGLCALPAFGAYSKCKGPDLTETITICHEHGEACEDSMQCCDGLCDYDENERLVCIHYEGRRETEE